MYFEYRTERLLLKIIGQEKADQVLDFYLRDKELFEQFEPDRMENFYTLGFQQQMLGVEHKMVQQGTMYRFYVYRKEQPEQIIGTISLHHISRGYFSSCEVGYKFSSAFHHQGYAREALSCVVEIVFRELGLNKVEAWVLPDNMPSIRLLERVGFSYEGISRAHLFMKGQWRDHAQFSMLASDYDSARRYIQ